MQPFPAVKCPTLRMAIDFITRSDAFAMGNVLFLRGGAEVEGVEALRLQAPWLFSKWGMFRLRDAPDGAEVTAAIESFQVAHEELLADWERVRSGAAVATPPGGQD